MTVAQAFRILLSIVVLLASPAVWAQPSNFSVVISIANAEQVARQEMGDLAIDVASLFLDVEWATLEKITQQMNTRFQADGLPIYAFPYTLAIEATWWQYYDPNARKNTGITMGTAGTYSVIAVQVTDVDSLVLSEKGRRALRLSKLLPVTVDFKAAEQVAQTSLEHLYSRGISAYYTIRVNEPQ